MNKEEIRKEIIVLIDNIKLLSDNAANKENFSPLEKDILLHKIEELYKNFIVFHYLNSLPEKTEEQGKQGMVASAETLIVEEKTEQTSSPEIAPNLIDLFGGEIPVTEKPKIEKKAEKEKNNEVQKPPIRDIKAAIGINDKFQFANELFQENMQEYAIAIQQLNAAENLDSAMNYFNSLQLLYNWDFKNETVKRLLDLINRRFS